MASTIPAVAVYTKQGLLFVFDRVTGKPIFGVEERPVVSNNPLPGDEYWPTQPFPLKPPPIARMSFSPEEIAKVTPEHEAYCKGLLELEGGALTGGPYAAVRAEAGGDFSGMDRRRQLERFGVQSRSRISVHADAGRRHAEQDDQEHPRREHVRAQRTRQRSADDGDEFLGRTEGWPCQQPPWGELIAVNINTGDVAWRVPLGSYEELDALGVPPTGTLNRGGPIATAGGLVFIAASQDARFRAFDARTGKVLWVADLTENGRAVPITYQGKRGKQYVAIMAGGGRPVARKVDESLIGGRLHVFALPNDS